MFKIIQSCYDNKHNQLYLCNLLDVPFHPGPVTLNKIPLSFLNFGEQLVSLFNYIKKVKEYYFCWVIYFDPELLMLNVKFFMKWEVQDYKYFDPQCYLAGIFIKRKCPEKARIYSVTESFNIGKNSKNGTLSSKATKDTMFDGDKFKSISMKEKKVKKDGKNKSRECSYYNLANIEKLQQVDKGEKKKSKKENTISDKLAKILQEDKKKKKEKVNRTVNPFLKK